MSSYYDGSYNTQNQEQQGGSVWVIGPSGILDFAVGAKMTNAGVQAGPTSAITDSTGGTPSTTLAAITAGASYAQADMVAVKNALASLAAQYNALLAILQGIGASS
jgi:hypothetical protein